jgi:hypothetical protein
VVYLLRLVLLLIAPAGLWPLLSPSPEAPAALPVGAFFCPALVTAFKLPVRHDFLSWVKHVYGSRKNDRCLTTIGQIESRVATIDRMPANGIEQECRSNK